jgi:phosphoribosyl-ATP pyrophosphohydrolase
MNIEELFKIIEERAKHKKKKSYTNKLLQLGPNKIAQKFGEESAELIIDYLKGSKKRTIEEAVDVIYHLIVLLKSKKITLNEINKELEKRKTNVR